MLKPSKAIREKKKEFMDNEGLSQRDAEFKAILWFLNQEYFKRPNNNNDNNDDI